MPAKQVDLPQATVDGPDNEIRRRSMDDSSQSGSDTERGSKLNARGGQPLSWLISRIKNASSSTIEQVLGGERSSSHGPSLSRTASKTSDTSSITHNHSSHHHSQNSDGTYSHHHHGHQPSLAISTDSSHSTPTPAQQPSSQTSEQSESSSLLRPALSVAQSFLPGQGGSKNTERGRKGRSRSSSGSKGSLPQVRLRSLSRHRHKSEGSASVTSAASTSGSGVTSAGSVAPISETRNGSGSSSSHTASLSDHNSINIDPLRRVSLDSLTGSGSKSIDSRAPYQDAADAQLSRRRSSDRETLRHAAIPVSAVDSNTRSPRCLVRVYRENRTFGTVACAADVTASALLKLASRKFFLNDSNYHLVMLFPDSVDILKPESQPIKTITGLVERAGFLSDGAQVADVIRSDISFLCRIYLSARDRFLRPPTHSQVEKMNQDKHKVELTNVDIDKLPDTISQGLVEYLDISRSTITDIDTRRIPYLRTLLLSGIYCENTILANHWASFGGLTRLDLSKNALRNPDFLHFEYLHQLQTLDLRGNQLTSLPKSLSECRYLRRLYVGSNALESYDLWSQYLEELDLSFNNLQYLGPEIGKLQHLRSFSIHGNFIQSLPIELGQIETLQMMDARYNFITHIPVELLKGIKKLRVSYNRPMKTDEHKSSLGSTPMSLSPSPSLTNIAHHRIVNITAVAERKSPGGPGRWHSLSPVGPRYRYKDEEAGGQVFFRSVRFMQWIPQTPLVNLTRLDLGRTSLLTLDDTVITMLPNLEVLELGFNNLTRLPPSIGQLKRLHVLTAWGNSIVVVPPEICTLPELRILDLHANNIKALPSQIWKLSKLRVLNVSSNLLEMFPSVRDPLTELEELYAGDNRLDDDCFHEIMRMPQLRILNLSNNELTELQPGLFAAVSNLVELQVGGNRISTLPHEDFENALHLRVLCANSNKLHTLPAELSKVQTLEILDVSANSLRYNVSNFPFDWNWRWNTKLRYLNFSSNRRLEIRRARGSGSGSRSGTDNLSDLNVLPHLQSLGLIDVTLTSSGVPDQTENCRVRTYGGDLSQCRVGVADSIGQGPLTINDLVIDRFRNEESEALIGLFDGFNSDPSRGGNKISHLTQENFGPILKRQLQKIGNFEDVPTALRRAFLALHREIGNTAVLTPEEIAHSFLGHHSSVASHLRDRDRESGTGATIVYMRGSKLNIASLGGGRVVVSRSNGEHKVLSRPQTFTPAEMDRMREGGGIVDGESGMVENIVPYSRMIGCYHGRSVFSAEPMLTEYDMDPHDIIIIANAELWDYLSIEIVADVARSEAQEPSLAALKIRDLALSYGMRERAMVIVLVPPVQGSRRDTSPDLRRHTPLRDSRLARLGNEVEPPLGDVTLVFTDIQNSTLLWETMPAVMRASIKIHNTIMRRSLRLMEGYEVKTEGDAFIVSFHTPIRALMWCLTVQEQLINAEWPPELLEGECSPVLDQTSGKLLFQGLRVRMGIHFGRPVTEPDPVTRRMDYFGPMVNRTARISGTAMGGQIAASSDFMAKVDQIRTLDPVAYESVKKMGYVVEDVGEMKLRGIESPEHLHVIYPEIFLGRRAWFAAAGDNNPSHMSVATMSPALGSTPGVITPVASAITTKAPPSPALTPSLAPGLNVPPNVDQGPIGSSLLQLSQSLRDSSVSGPPSINIVQPSAEQSSEGYEAPRHHDEIFTVRSVSHQLEVLCAKLGGGDAESMKQLLAVEPISATSLELWVTRIENSIARLTLELGNPRRRGCEPGR